MKSGTHVRAFRRVVRHGTKARISRMVEKRPSPEVAELMACLSRPEAQRVARALVASGRGASPLACLPEALLQEVLASLQTEELAQLIGVQARDGEESAFFLSHLAVGRRDKVLDLLPSDRRAQLMRLAHYPKDSAGALMTTAVFVMGETDSVQQAIEKFQESQPELEASFYLHVVDEEGRLTGVLSLRQLILCSPKLPLGECLHDTPVSVQDGADRSDLAALVDAHKFLSLPVTDGEGCLLGAVTVDRVIEAFPDRPPHAPDSPAPVPALRPSPWRVLRGFVSSSVLKVGTVLAAFLSLA